ncbi:MAG TPA: metalloregulator ArsR/SmtB family transcription factor [Acidimicrobiales bacterium]|nr:metalloregulator ArsR/SmtB family transcription factor [Acidimicrobiales bacterium]
MYPDDEAIETTAPDVVVRPSIAIELDWVLSLAIKTLSSQPAVDEMYRSHPDLVAEVQSLWGADERLPYCGFPEIEVLAAHAGMLFSTDTDALFAALADAAADPPAHLPFLTEKPEARIQLNRRLEVLRSSSERRQHYLEVVSRVWSQLRPEWERAGMPAITAEIAQREAELRRDPDWLRLTPEICRTEQPFDELVDELGTDGVVAFLPAYFAGKGLIVDVPGALVLGVGVRSESAARARTELLARRLKAIADPTRLAVLDGLARHELTVTEIARRYSLAQPTVSNHIKLLREAGFVSSRSEGRSRLIQLDRDVVTEVFEELRQLLGCEAAAPA